MVWCHTENDIDYMVYPLKPWIISPVPAHGLNFWSSLYDILGGITSSKIGHLVWFIGGMFFVVKRLTYFKTEYQLTRVFSSLNCFKQNSIKYC